MLYSRPNIKPLNIDLEELPIYDQCKTHEAKTTDGNTLSMRFSGGHLSVTHSGQNLPPNSKTRLIENALIDQLYGYHILPEQLCAMLGLTVKGQMINHPTAEKRNRYPDFSGETTYWESSHRMLYAEEHNLVEKIINSFPDATIFQQKAIYENGKITAIMSRKSTFLMKTDICFSVGIGGNQDEIDDFIKSTDINKNIFPLRLYIDRDDDHLVKECYHGYTGEHHIPKHLKEKIKNKYEVYPHYIWKIRASYQTEDKIAQKNMELFLALLNNHFCHNEQYVNLENGEIIKDYFDERRGIPSYSKKFRDWCIEKPHRYLTIGYEGIRENYLTDLNEEVFYGLRPIQP